MITLLKVFFRAAFIVLVLLITFFPLLIVMWLRRPLVAAYIAQYSLQLMCLVMGIHIARKGKLSSRRPLMVISNHFSYLDIFVLGALLPVRFTPKSEIASWPYIGFLSKLTGSVFIERKASKTIKNKNAVSEILKGNTILSVFPEGTTNEGTHLLLFKPSLLSVAIDSGVLVQPLTVRYIRLDGKSLDNKSRPQVGWYGDASFFPHLIAFLRHKTLDVEVVFHEPVQPASFASRKELSQYCHDVISKELGFHH